LVGCPATASLATAGSYDVYIARYSQTTMPRRSVNERRNIGDEGISMQIAPNPFTGEFTLRLDGTSAPARVQVVDMMGAIVESREVAEPGNEITLGAELPAGAYFVEVVQGEMRRQMLVHKVK
jgi:hypothetical protein